LAKGEKLIFTFGTIGRLKENNFCIWHVFILKSGADEFTTIGAFLISFVYDIVGVELNFPKFTVISTSNLFRIRNEKYTKKGIL
jgi:hypothetical protein